MWLIIVIIIGVVIWAYSSAKEADRKKAIEYEEARKKRERIAYIKKSYPNAYMEYWDKDVDPSPFYKYHHGLAYDRRRLRKANETLSDLDWAELEKRVKQKREVEKKERESKEWEKAQDTFSSKMRNLSGEILVGFGNYTYTYNITTKYGTSLNMKVWQHFAFETCLESDLDYTYNKLTQNNNSLLPKWKEKGLVLSEQGQNQIRDFIAQLTYGKKVVILCNENVEGWNDNALCITYTNIKKPDCVKKINVMAQRALGLESKSGIEQLVNESPDIVLVIDAFTTNDQLKRNCESIFTTLQERRPLLAYISLVKTYDRAEMIAYIERSKTEAEIRAAEERAKEEERKRREAERARLLETAPSIFKENVKSWEHLFGNFYYNYLFYYYPTTCEFEANEEEWWNRRNVWDFKNDPARNILPADHESTLKEIIPKIKQKLCDTFGEEYLQFLTLVCLPASTKIKNDARYDDFSNRLCAETGMENGYLHTHIVKDGMSKNDPNNPSNHSIQPEVSFDDCFEGKFVLLFDDVITKGGTMLRYKDIMERMGATVVGGFTLGKTKHERPVQQRFVPIEEPPHIFNSGDELPF